MALLSGFGHIVTICLMIPLPCFSFQAILYLQAVRQNKPLFPSSAFIKTLSQSRENRPTIWMTEAGIENIQLNNSDVFYSLLYEDILIIEN